MAQSLQNRPSLGQGIGSQRDLHTCKMESNGDGYELAMGKDIYGPESALHTGSVGETCPKHPGHKGFIPIKEFTIEHLPENCKDREYCFDLLQSAADLVVHISASYVSTERPRGFPLYEDRGSIALRDGSGFVIKGVPCGQSGQGHEVVADWIENLLEKYKLSEIGSGIIYNADHFICKDVSWIIHDWGHRKLFHQLFLNKFTRDLIHEIEKSKRSSSRSTLNEYRKGIGMSVSEFCLALISGIEGYLSNSGRLGRLNHDEFFSLLDQPCPCSECHQSGTPKNTWWMKFVRTAAHVIFDNQESDGARVSVFYDDRNSQRVIMRGIGGKMHKYKSVEKAGDDVSYFLCSLHDDDVGQRLLSQIDRLGDRKGDQACTAVISHPHGSTKHISFGKRLQPDNSRREEYSAPTCPGSSGGLVIGTDVFFPASPPSHSRAVGADRNRSGDVFALCM